MTEVVNTTQTGKEKNSGLRRHGWQARQDGTLDRKQVEHQNREAVSDARPSPAEQAGQGEPNLKL